MKLLMRVVIGLLVAVVLIVVVLVAARNLIIKAGASATIKAITGVELKIGSLDIGLFEPVIHIKDLKLLNPAKYPEPMMMSLPELYVKYDLPAIIKGTIHLPEIRLSLNEFVVVKNIEGNINVNELAALQPKASGGTQPGQAKPQGPAPKIRIDLLELQIGKVVYKEYRSGGAPREQVYNINLKERYENITDPNVLVGLIVSKALRNTAISGISGTLRSADQLLGGASDLVIQSGKKVTDEAIKATSTITNTLDRFIK